VNLLVFNLLAAAMHLRNSKPLTARRRRISTAAALGGRSVGGDRLFKHLKFFQRGTNSLPLKIGILLSFTGDFADPGTAAKKGYEL
jgi:hypothetical protein